MSDNSNHPENQTKNPAESVSLEPIKKRKLTVDEVIEYLKAPVVIENPGQDLSFLSIPKHSHVVIHVINEAGNPLAYIKPGPLSEAEGKYIRDWLSAKNGTHFHLSAPVFFLDMVGWPNEFMKDMKSKPDGPDLDKFRSLASDYNNLTGWSKEKEHVPWTEEDHQQLCLQIIKDAKEGRWFKTSDIRVINFYSAFTEGGLNLSMNEWR